jgi:hypothetical protein
MFSEILAGKLSAIKKTDFQFRCPISEKSLSPNQFVENVVIEHDVFAGAAAFDVFHEIRQRIIGAADRDIANCAHDFLEPPPFPALECFFP